MKKQAIIIIILLIIVLIISKLYHKTWKGKQQVKEFLEQEKGISKQELEFAESSIVENPTKGKQETVESNPSKNEVKKNIDNYLKSNISFEGDSQYIIRPYVVRTHKSKDFYTIIQDNEFSIYLINSKGEKIWKRNLEGKIISDIYEIDFIRNRKIQYLFATSSNLYLIDYNGKSVGKYPHKLSQINNPEYLNLIDYANNRNYRILIANQEGNIYLTDKRFKALIGWYPKKLDSTFVRKPIHIRVKPRDYFLTAHKDGKINLLSRRGESYKGFPISLPDSLKDFLVIKGTTSVTTKLFFLTESGSLFDYDLNGNQKGELILSKKGDDYKISLCLDNIKKDSFIVAKETGKKIFILDQNGNNIFSMSKSKEDELVVNYYNLVKNKKLYLIYNKTKMVSSLYDFKGKIINQKPIESDQEPTLKYYVSSNSVNVYSCGGRKLNVFKIKLN